MNISSNITKTIFWASMFAIINVAMYLTLHKFWIGGSSFLPLVGEFGPNNKFVFALVVNLGVVVGAFLSAYQKGEFIFRTVNRNNLGRAILGGFLIGVGVALAPGTCTTAFVTGIPMLSIASFLSAAGIFMGAYLAFKLTWKR